MTENEQTDEDFTTDDADDTTTDVPETTTDVPDTDATEEDTDAPEIELTETEDEVPEEKVDKVPVQVDKKPTAKVQKKMKRKKRKFSMQKCMNKRWTCADTAQWRIYMKMFAEDQEQLEKDDIMKRRKPANLRKFPRVQSEEHVTAPYKCLPLNAFQLRDKSTLPDKLDRSKMVRVWKNMRADLPVNESKSDMEITSRVSKTDSQKWSSMWPCTKRDFLKELQKYQNLKKTNLFPCDMDEVEEDIYEDPNKDFSDRKELGHARIPQVCPPPTRDMLVDRAAGEQPGLVDGDYIVFELPSKARGTRVYADVCLRGLKGMHLLELGLLRQRRKTWKFCFYQAVVALLAKTQLRYKYAWSANIDYIYDHAWMLYTHIGMINVKEKQRLDDIVVYNYKYSVELELICELNDVPIITGIGWDYEEENLRRKRKLERRELMNVRLEIGSEKITDRQRMSVHKGTRRIEEWFDKLKIRYRNCIFRTTRFCLAFWRDNLFWYLYNPYRCDEFGYWDDDGRACILKFCSRDSLKRHLMILLLRAYVHMIPKSDMRKKKDAAPKPPEPVMLGEDAPKSIKSAEPIDEVCWEEEFYTIQIYHVTHHCCQIHNLRLLQREAPKPAQHLVKRKTIDDCPFDPLDVRDPCTIEREEGESKHPIEKPLWLKLYKRTWTKCINTTQKKRTTKEPASDKMRWHQYVVNESYKLFSLWGELHVTDSMFEPENRGMQTYACYVVCAGMTRIMAPEYWSSKILDVIVMCGDRYYTHSKLEADFKSTKNEYSHVHCWNRYLMSHFKIGETIFEAKVLPAISGRLYSKSNRYLWQALEQMFLKYQFGILTCESSCLGLFKFCGAYYMYDVNSFGPPLFTYGEGAAYLIRATYFFKFMTTLVLTVGSPDCSQFTLNPIEILTAVEMNPTDLPIGKYEKTRGALIAKTECPHDEERKKQMKKWKHRRQKATKLIDKLCCKDT